MRRSLLARCLTAAVAVGLLASPSLAHASPDGSGNTGAEVSVGIPGEGSLQVRNGQFRWGLNNESGSGAYFGACNFLSAGKAPDAGGARLWTEADGFLKASDGQVSVTKPVNGSGDQPISWSNKCTDPAGQPLSAADYRSSGVQAVIDGGTGSIDPSTNSAQLTWKGAVSIVFYGGLTYWWFADPELSLSEDSGQVTATLGGYGTSMDDMTKWEVLPQTKVVLADLSGVTVSEQGGFSTVPAYEGVEIQVGAGGSQIRDGNSWGSFPQSFVDYQSLTGQHSYWYSSGGQRDLAKPTTTLYISYDADRPITHDPGGDSVDSGGGMGGALPGGDNQPIGGPMGAGSGGNTTTTTNNWYQNLPMNQPPPLADQLDPSAAQGQFPPTWASLPSNGLQAISGLLDSAGGWFSAPRNRLLSLAGVALGSGSALFLGLRQGWLTLPWRRPGGS